MDELEKYFKTIKTFTLQDLVGKHVSIEYVFPKSGGDVVILQARDLNNGTVYILDVTNRNEDSGS